MEWAPNLNEVSLAMRKWQRGLITTSELLAAVQGAFTEENFVPADECIQWFDPDPDPDTRLLARLDAVERKLDAVLRALGNRAEAAGLLAPEVMRLADAGQLLAAIKRHRELTGVGLAEAKRAIDEYLARKPV